MSDDDEDSAHEKPAEPTRGSRRLKEKSNDPREVYCSYPAFQQANGSKECISITYGDMGRLQSDRGLDSESLLLNDTLVDFYVKYLLEQVRTLY